MNGERNIIDKKCTIKGTVVIIVIIILFVLYIDLTNWMTETFDLKNISLVVWPTIITTFITIVGTFIITSKNTKMQIEKQSTESEKLHLQMLNTENLNRTTEQVKIMVIRIFYIRKLILTSDDLLGNRISNTNDEYAELYKSWIFWSLKNEVIKSLLLNYDFLKKLNEKYKYDYKVSNSCREVIDIIEYVFKNFNLDMHKDFEELSNVEINSTQMKKIYNVVIGESYLKKIIEIKKLFTYEEIQESVYNDKVAMFMYSHFRFTPYEVDVELKFKLSLLLTDNLYDNKNYFIGSIEKARLIEYEILYSMYKILNKSKHDIEDLSFKRDDLSNNLNNVINNYSEDEILDFINKKENAYISYIINKYYQKKDLRNSLNSLKSTIELTYIEEEKKKNGLKFLTSFTRIYCCIGNNNVKEQNEFKYLFNNTFSIKFDNVIEDVMPYNIYF